MKNTLPETNIAPENGPSQKETSIPTIHFQGICWFQGGYFFFGGDRDIYSKVRNEALYRLLLLLEVARTLVGRCLLL